MEEIISKISVMAEWYKHNSRKAGIDKLLSVKDSLVTYNYNLAELLSEHKKQYNFAYYIRKISITKSRNAYVNQGHASNKAESISTEEHAEKLEQELELEHISVRLELLSKATRDIIRAIEQRVSYLKQEKINDYNFDNILKEINTIKKHINI